MSQTIVKKNHMDIPWHDFTDAEKDEPVSPDCTSRKKGGASIKGEPKRKSLCYRQGGNDVSLLRNGSVACEKFHEHHVGMYGTDLHSRYRAYVHKLHLF